MNQTISTIYDLRSIHGDFSEKEVTDADLKIILDSCVRAANASARQSYAIVAVTDRRVIKERFAYGGSKALLFCVDYNRIISSAHQLGHEFANEGILSFITGSTDTILAAQTAAIAAKSLGIDSLFTNSVHRCDIKGLYEAFNLPKKHCFPLIALILGYPKKEPEFQKSRLNGTGVIHYNQYHAADDHEIDEIIAQYDDNNTHLAMNNNWVMGGFSHYLDWFYTVWCGGENSIKQKEVYSILRDAEFIE